MDIRVYDSLPEAAADIRRQVFMDEQGFRDEFDEYEDNSIHFVGYIDGVAVGTCRIHFAPEFSAYKIGRIAVVKSCRGRHIGEKMVQCAEEYLVSKEIRDAVILAQNQAVGFYEKLGYSKTDYTCVEEHCPHVLMTKKL